MNVTSVLGMASDEPLTNYTTFIQMGTQIVNPGADDFMGILTIIDTKKML